MFSPPVWLRLHPRRLLVAPRVEVTSAGSESIRVTVHGLVCGVCALRTRSALLATPGVQDVCVDLDAAVATVSLEPAAVLDVVAAQRELERVVVAMPLRRLIERSAERCRETLRAMGARRVEGRGA